MKVDVRKSKVGSSQERITLNKKKKSVRQSIERNLIESHNNDQETIVYERFDT
jgi:hypothetical protein